MQSISEVQAIATQSAIDWALSRSKALDSIQYAVERTVYKIHKAACDDSSTAKQYLDWFNEMVEALPDDYAKRFVRCLKACKVAHHPQLGFYDIGAIGPETVRQLKEKQWHRFTGVEDGAKEIKQLNLAKEAESLGKKIAKQEKLHHEYGDKLYQPVDKVAQRLLNHLASGMTGAMAIAKVMDEENEIAASQDETVSVAA